MGYYIANAKEVLYIIQLFRGDYMNDYLTIGTWSSGPGRSMDSSYLLLSIEKLGNLLSQSFLGKKSA